MKPRASYPRIGAGAPHLLGSSKFAKALRSKPQNLSASETVGIAAERTRSCPGIGFSYLQQSGAPRVVLNILRALGDETVEDAGQICSRPHGCPWAKYLAFPLNRFSRLGRGVRCVVTPFIQNGPRHVVEVVQRRFAQCLQVQACRVLRERRWLPQQREGQGRHKKSSVHGYSSADQCRARPTEEPIQGIDGGEKSPGAYLQINTLGASVHACAHSVQQHPEVGLKVLAGAFPRYQSLHIEYGVGPATYMADASIEPLNATLNCSLADHRHW